MLAPKCGFHKTVNIIVFKPDFKLYAWSQVFTFTERKAFMNREKFVKNKRFYENRTYQESGRRCMELAKMTNDGGVG